MKPAWNWSLWGLALLALSACVPAPLGSGLYAPFVIGRDAVTTSAGQTVYASRTYDQHNWILRTVLDNQGNILSRTLRDLGYETGPTWSQQPDAIVNDLLDERRCGLSGDEANRLLLYFYLRTPQLPPGWSVDLQTQEVLQCGQADRSFDFVPRSGQVTVIERPITTFYRLNYIIRVPQGVAPGQYSLALEPNDPHSRKSVTENIPVTVR
jgi:hypothetical protein